MPEHVCHFGRLAGQRRFVFKTPDELEDLNHAKHYFGHNKLLLNNGLEYNLSVDSARNLMNKLKKGERTVSYQNHRRIQHYALLDMQGKSYDEETFVRPDIV